MRRRYERVKTAGLIIFFGAGAVYCFWKESPLLVGLVMLPGTLLLGLASVLHWRLPHGEKDRADISIHYGVIHIYLTFFTATVLNVGILFGAFECRGRMGKTLFFGILALYLLGQLASATYAYWYVFTDQEKKRKRREEHRRRHGKWGK